LARYVAKRFGYMLFTLWIIITLTFMMMHALPGDPFIKDNRKIPPAVLANLKIKYGLDKPLYEQYYVYMKNLAHGDLGVSMRSQSRTVNEMISGHFPISAELGLWALVYAVIGGLALGIMAALHRNKWPDFLAMMVAVVGVSVPGFVLGTLMQWLFSVNLKILPVAGWSTPQSRILPALMLGLGTLALNARMMRSSMLDVLAQDYIKTARAKGLSPGEVVWRHAIRNAMLPIVTILGPVIVNLTTGSLIIEAVFGIPGLGKYYVQAITDNDYTLILGTTVFYAALLIAALFLVDIAYGLVDPRIRLVRGKA
jgi:ABC-type dipeptide/oligopeptide/nickel transport system permease component